MSICQRTHLRQSRYISTPIGAIDVLIIKNNKDMMTNLQSSAFVARTTQLLSSVARLRLLLVMLLTLTVSANAWGTEEVVYTLTPASGSNNSYAGNCDVTIDDIKWNLTGNSTTTYWRIGGKSITNVDRALYSKTAIQEDISKIVISHGAASSITVNSVKLIVSTASNGTGTTISSLDGSFSANSTMTFTRPAGTSWANAYYKFVYNVTVSGSSNKFVEFKEAKFYAETAPAVQHSITFNAGSGTCDTESLTETSAGAGVILPTATIDCGDVAWTFAGWAEASVSTETEEAPTTLYEADDTYKPTSDITLYAVYQRTEEGEGGGSTPTEVSKTYTFSDYEEGTQYAAETYELDDDVTINITGCHINTQLRVYGAQPGIVISEELPGRIVSMGFNMGYKADELVVSGSADGTSWNEVGRISTTTSYKDYTLDFGETNYTYFKLNVAGSSQIRIANLSITYESTSGGGTTTTYYYSTPQCTTETAVYLIPFLGYCKYEHVRSGNEVVSLLERYPSLSHQIDFHHINMSKITFAAKLRFSVWCRV